MTNKQSTTLTILRDCAPHAVQIAAITREAFLGQYGSGDGEVALIAGLRADRDVIVELVGVRDGAIVGHAMFSQMVTDPSRGHVAALAPVAVRTGHQRAGIGSSLIRAGLLACEKKGIEAVFVLGDSAYYERFGFSAAKAEGIACAYSGPHFQVLELRSGALVDLKSVAYAPAFAAV